MSSTQSIHQLASGVSPGRTSIGRRGQPVEFDTRAGPGAPAAATLAGELLTAVRAPVVGATQIPPQGHAGEEAGEADQGGECDGAGHRRGPRSARRLSSPRRSSAGSSSAREVTYGAVKVSTPVPRWVPGR